jgi:hypothetical protein
VLLIGVPGHNVALGSDNVRRAIPPRSDRLGFVEFNCLPVINIRTESRFDSIKAVRAAIVAEARAGK